MSNLTITIIGAGVVGTSLGLALKQAENPPTLIIHDKDLEYARAAVKQGAFDRAEWNLINACDNAGLIILAIPAAAIQSTLQALSPELKPDTVISDTAPTKTGIIALAKQILPPHIHFVGGHPLVSPAGKGIQYARADLFRQTLYCLTPDATVVPEAVKLMEDVATLAGAVPFYLDPVEHDGLMSGIDMLPALLGITLINRVSQPASWREMRKLAGGLFAQASAGACGDPDSLAGSWLENKENMIRWIESITTELQTVQHMLATGNPEPLAQWIDHAVVTRAGWYKDFESKGLSNLLPEGVSEKIEKPGMLKQLFGFGKK